MFNPNKLLRANIRSLKPYASAREEFEGKADILLDANENPFDNGLNRYPDPLQRQLKKAIAKTKGVNSAQVFFENGSDEAIDLLIRCFCEPGQEKILITPPTFGMFTVMASINNVGIVKVPLNESFDLNEEAIREQMTDEAIKIIFFCSPNNPTGNLMNADIIARLTKDFHGLVVVDEAYIDFSPEASFLPLLDQFPNLVVLQTMSKAWGMAAIRLGMAFADPSIIQVLTRVKAPYNIGLLNQEAAIQSLQSPAYKNETVEIILEEKEKLIEKFRSLDFVQKVFPSDTNFFLVRVKDAKALYGHLAANGIIVRDRSSVIPETLRISVGIPEENERLVEVLCKFEVLVA